MSAVIDRRSYCGRQSHSCLAQESSMQSGQELAMAAFSGALMRQDVRNAMLEAEKPEEIIEILKGSKKA